MPETKPIAESEDDAPGEMVCILSGVREYEDGRPVELWRTLSGRLVIRAYAVSGNASTYVDLWDLMDWLQTGSIQTKPGVNLSNEPQAFETMRRDQS